MFPTITEAITGERLTVGPPFFNKWMTPVGLLLLFLTGVGPLLAWRKTHRREPGAAVHVADDFGRGGRRRHGRARRAVLGSGLCFALCGFVFGTITQEYIRGANVRKATSGADLLTAMVGLVGRNKRRYGGYIVHLGIVLIFLGFAGEGMSRDEQLLMKPGEQAVVGRLHAAPRCAARHRRRAEADDHGAHLGEGREGQRPRPDAPGEVVLPQARGSADDRGRDPPHRSRKTSTS